MGSSRPLLAVLSQAGLAVAAVTSFAAAHAGFYATALLAGLIALWIAIVVAWSFAAREAPAVRSEPELTPVHTLRAELVMLRALLDQIPAPIVMAGPDGQWEAVNMAARRLFQTEGRLRDPPPALQALVAASHLPGPQLLTLSNGEEERSFALSITDAVRGGEPGPRHDPHKGPSRPGGAGSDPPNTHA